MNVRTSSHFKKAFKKIAKKNPVLVDSVIGVCQQLADDPFQPSLRTHKLTGRLRYAWACSAGYDLRIIFSIVEDGGEKEILLINVGGHDEVY